MVFLYCFLRLNLKTRILAARSAPTMVPCHFAAGNQFAAFFERCLNGKLDFRADVAGQFFDADHITGATRYCFPPVR